MRSPINWFGGKGHLVKEILPLVPPHDTYVEPFAGGASVFFAKPVEKATNGKPMIEVLNDMDSMIVNFYRVLRDYPLEFHRQAEVMPYSREEFENSERVLGKTVVEDDIDRCIWMALYFFVACRQSISGQLKGWGYCVRANANKTGKWMNSIEGLPMVVERLMMVQVEHLDALDCIKRYDTDKTFFYVDPPYHHSVRSKARYRVDFSNHTNLFHLLNECKGSWLLSGYHCSHHDRLAERFKWHWKDIETVNRSAATTKTSGLTGEGKLLEKQQRTEVLWWNDNLVKAGHQINMFEYLERNGKDAI